MQQPQARPAWKGAASTSSALPRVNRPRLHQSFNPSHLRRPPVAKPVTLSGAAHSLYHFKAWAPRALLVQCARSTAEPMIPRARTVP